MAADTDEELKAGLLRLQGRMTAFSDVMQVLGVESAKVAAFESAEDDAPLEEQLVSSKELAMLSVEAVRACALRINQLFEEAQAEFEDIKSRLGQAQNLSRH